MKNLLIRTRFFLLLAIFVAGLGVYGLLSFRTLDQVKVEGPIYREIIRNKDLIADILPPPEYIIEPYLICHQLLSADAAQQQLLLDRLKALQRDYQQRHEFWRGQPLDPRLADLLLKQSHDPAVAFFALALERFAPALLAGERQAAQALMPRLDAEYQKHRLAIDEIVKIATERAASGEQQAAQAISASTARLAAAFALSLAACIAAALLITRSIVGPLDAAVAIAKRFASGDLGGRIDADGRSELAQLMAALCEMQSSLTDVVARVRDDALWLAQASAEIAQGNHDLAGRTEAQAQSLAQTTASMGEFGDNVQHNADSAHQASAVAAQASGIVEQAGRIVADVVSTMDEIDESSRRIADIIVLIDSIAFQTNILALNAAVEAARAGEQGRGFAVVASEVQNLARRSASAAKEIKSLIDVSVAQVGKGNRLVGDAGRTMADVVATIRRVNDLMSEIRAASSQQSLGVQQVGQAVAQMDEATQQNAAMVEQMASAASGLREQADSLVELVSVFKLDAAPMPRASAPG